MINLLKALLPNPLKAWLSQVFNYLRRLKMLLEMYQSFEGQSAQDRQVLKNSLRSAPRRLLIDLAHYRYPTLLDDAVIKVRGGRGVFPIRANTDDLAHILPSFQKDLTRYVRKFVRSGDVVVDAGANIGVATLILSRSVGPDGKVISVEMMPDTARSLRRTIELNELQNVEVYENALSELPGQLVCAKVETGLHGQASIARSDNRTGLKEVSVTTTTLDALTEAQPDIRFLKLDLEGAEGLALRGGAETLSKTKAIFMETWYPDSDPALHLLTEAGFNVTLLGLDVLATRDLINE